MLNIVITFDYELFFEESYLSENEVLVNPTNDIMEVLKKNNISATFFVDILAVKKYKTIGKTDISQKLENQIKNLYCNGNDIQLHIHPIWEKNKYENDKWLFEEKHHSFLGFEKNEDLIKKIIKEGNEYLKKTLYDVDRNYKAIAYRAGSFCLEPTDLVLPILKEIGITIDSSICKDTKIISDAYRYNYKKMPQQVNWWFSPSDKITSCVKKNESTSIYEVPVGSIPGLYRRYQLIKHSKKLPPIIAKGSFTEKTKKSTFFIKKIYNRIKLSIDNSIMFSLDGYHYELLCKMVDYYLCKYDCQQNDYYIAIIGHPKMFDKNRVDNLNSFIVNINEKYKDVRFITMKEIYEEELKND